MAGSLKYLVAMLGSVAIFAADPAHAQTKYPNGTVRIIVGSSPGGSTDAVARIVANGLTSKWGSPVIVENREGAMNSIAAEHVARSAPDGQTLLMASPQHTQAPSQMKLNFDAVKDFAPITMVTTYPTYLVVNKANVPVSTVAEFVEYAKKNPGKLNFASAGKGSGQFRNGSILMNSSNVKMEVITYAGGSPAMVALMGGEADVTFTPLSGIKSADPSKITVLGVTSAKPSPFKPEVRPIADTVPGFDEFDWHALLAPAGTPPDLVKKIRDDVAAVAAEPKAREMIEALGVTPLVNQPDEFKAFVAADVPKWAAFFKSLPPSK